MALMFPPMLYIYIPDFWFQQAYLCFMSTQYVSMTGRKMQVRCRKINFPPSSVPKTDPPPENGADISTNVEYIFSRFLISIGLSMFYVDLIRFHDWEEDAIMVSKTLVPTMFGNKNRSSCWKWRWYFYHCWVYIFPFSISIGLSMFYVDLIRFHDWEEDAIMVSKT